MNCNWKHALTLTAAGFAALLGPAKAKAQDGEVDKPQVIFPGQEFNRAERMTPENAMVLARLICDASRPLDDRLEACRSLVPYGPVAAPAVPQLIRQLFSPETRSLRAGEFDEPNPTIRFKTALVEAIAGIGPAAAEQSLPAVCRVFAETCNEIVASRHATKDGFYGTINHDVFDRIIEDDFVLCGACFKALGAFGRRAEPAVPMLIKALQSRTAIFIPNEIWPLAPERVAELMECLGKIRSSSALAALNEVRLSGADELLRQAADDAIAAIRGAADSPPPGLFPSAR
jgi:hypothetical protein